MLYTFSIMPVYSSYIYLLRPLTEWAYSGKKGRDGKSKKIDKMSKKGKK